MGDQTPDSSNTVTVFLRLRPVPKRSHNVHVDKHDGSICFEIPRDEAAGLVNNQREKYSFLFNGILSDDCSQEEVFERVCHASLSDFMAGINATVFAYGQTGSGKTFTITGGPERYADRGLIPRAISKVFASMAQDSHQLYTLHISYMEIYNHAAFDLLDPSREIKELSDLPPVTILEDEDGKYHMRGLSLNRADTAEEALNLLFLGDTNRMIAETPMNMASSRSHCVFTMHLEARRPGESVVRRSKLHMVDLAGSERVGRTGIDGTILAEAKYINASLHFLEQVIIALQERSMGIARPHVPYRNSLMTMVLRDSLGGNCKTSMIANITTAQRVAMVSNTATVNEETDPTLVIKALRQQVRELKDQVKLLQGGEEMRGPITQSEQDSLAVQVQEYVNDASPEAQLDLGASMLSITAAFQAFKELCRNTAASGTPGPATQPGAATAISSSAPQSTAHSHVQSQSGGIGLKRIGSSGAEEPPNKGVQALQEENTKLRLQVQQRDNELSILVSMLKKREAVIQAAANTATEPINVSSETAKHPQGPGGDSSSSGGPDDRTASGDVTGEGKAKEGGASEPPNHHAVLFDLNSLADRNRAFELFRKSYRRNEAIESSKMELKEHYAAAKAHAAEASSVKGQVQAAKADLEQRRLRRSAADIASGGDGTSKKRDTSRDAEFAAEMSEDSRRAEEIQTKTAQYKKAFDGLRERKHVIEALHARLENSRKQMAKDFVNWYQKMSEFFPNGQPTGDVAAAAVAAVQKGGLFSETSRPAAGDTVAVSTTGPSQLRGSPATAHRSSPLAAVPEHQVVSQEGPSSSAMALARSAAQIPMSDAAPPVLSNSTAGPSHHRAPGLVSGTAHFSDTQNLAQASNSGYQASYSGDARSSSGRAHTGSSLSTGGYSVPVSASTARSLSRSVGTTVGSSGSGDPGHVAAGGSSRSGTAEIAAKMSSVGIGGGAKYPPEVLEAAKPYLTGDAVADEDILGFYMARHSMIHGGG